MTGESAESKPHKSSGATTFLWTAGGVVVAWVITKALDGWAAENQWPWWAYGIGIAVGGVLTLFILSLVTGARRRRFWGWIPKLWMRIPWAKFTPVVTTRQRIADGRKVAYEEGVLVHRPPKHLGEAHLVQMVSVVEAPERKEPPPPKPRWTLDRAEDGEWDEFILANPVEGSVAMPVRLNTQPDEANFQIMSSGNWEDMSGPSEEMFRARFSQEKLMYGGIKLVVTYWDENGEEQTEYATLPPAF